MKVRTIVDLLMIVLMPMLMAYALIGEAFHEIAGTVAFALFIIHHWLNRGFWKGFFKGKYTPQRVCRTVVNMALVAVMVLQPLSGMVMSRYLFRFLPSFGMTASARLIHLLFAYWGFVLMSFHAGTHLETVFSGIKRKNAKAVPAVKGILAVAAAYGVYAFFRRGIPQYMFARSLFVFFDFGEPLVFFMLDYLSVMVLWGYLGYCADRALKRAAGPKSKRK